MRDPDGARRLVATLRKQSGALAGINDRRRIIAGGGQVSATEQVKLLLDSMTIVMVSLSVVLEELIDLAETEPQAFVLPKAKKGIVH